MSWNIKNWATEDAVTVAPIEYPGATQYQDARSAAFYAMGIAIKKGTPVTLVVPGHYLSSTYTAITEAWFQKANVIVVALFEKVSEVKTSWMDRCVLKTATFGVDEQDAFLEMVANAQGLPGPVLINLTGYTWEENTIDYSDVLAVLRAIDPAVKITAYCPKHADVTAVSANDKYGLISKYIGMSVAKNSGILLCPAQCALIDMNIFRTRYSNSNMKIVLLDNNNTLGDLDVSQWITGNGWDCLASDAADETGAKWLLSRQRQAVWIIR